MRERISKENSCQLPVSPEERLFITLRYLATGKSQRDLVFAIKIVWSTIYLIIIIDVCEEILNVLNKYVRPTPDTGDWKSF